MKIATTVARVLLGLLFLAAGLSGFVFTFNPPPVPPGLAGSFQRVFFESHWVLFVGAVELFSAVLLLANRYVPLALIALAGVIFNILVFHITLAPDGLPIACMVLALWIIASLQHRVTFGCLLGVK